MRRGSAHLQPVVGPVPAFGGSPAPEPSVSVIVPVYNRESLIVGTLESVLAQHLPPFEVIVVDDGSTDGTAEVLKAFAKRDPRIRYVFQENGGPGAARNKGISEARGDWVAFIDSDDLWEPDKLSNFRSLLERNPGLDFVHTNWQRQYLDGTRDRPRDTQNFDSLATKEYLLRTYCLKTSTVIIRKSLLGRIGEHFYTDSPLYEDFHLFWRAVMEANAIGYIRSSDTIAIQSKVSLVRSIAPETNTRAKIFAMDRVCRWIETRSLPPGYKAIFRSKIYREYQVLFRSLIRKRQAGEIAQELRICSRILSPWRATRALLSSAVDELQSGS